MSNFEIAVIAFITVICPLIFLLGYCYGKIKGIDFMKEDYEKITESHERQIRIYQKLLDLYKRR